MRGLDWFVFCVADVQTGFGPFVSVYLTTQKWTQIDIGLILSVAGLVALAAQVPGVEVATFCDPDETQLQKRGAQFEQLTGKKL